MLGAMTIPPLRSFLALATPNPAGWVLIGGASLTALLLSRGLASMRPPAAIRRTRILPASDAGAVPLLPAPAM
jgi:hypothetical protein